MGGSTNIVVNVDAIRYLILNVYLPVDNRTVSYVSAEFADCIDVIEQCLNEHKADFILIGGDCNTALEK